MSAQDDFAKLAKRKAIIQFVQEFLRGTLKGGLMDGTGIVSSDLPPLTGAVTGHSVLQYVEDLEREVTAIDRELSTFTLVRKEPSERSADSYNFLPPLDSNE